jgi:hypothetical protein
VAGYCEQNNLVWYKEEWLAIVNTVMNVGFEVLTAVSMKMAVFWVVAW